jgi:hypothetical protein
MVNQIFWLSARIVVLVGMLVSGWGALQGRRYRDSLMFWHGAVFLVINAFLAVLFLLLG